MNQVILYIDPGTGSMLFTIIIGAVSAGFFVLQKFKLKLKFLLSGGKAVTADEDKIPYVIFSDSKKELAEIREQIEEFLFTELHLSLNKKTTIRPIALGIDFVGYHMWATHRKLKKQTARRIIRHVTNMCEMIAKGELSKETFDRAAASYNGIFRYCNSYGLRRELNRIYKERYLDIAHGSEEASGGPDTGKPAGLKSNTTEKGGERDGR